MICPHLQPKQECPHNPQCELDKVPGKTMCVEWVKKERRVGYKLAGEQPTAELKEFKG